ncbi:zinc finger FYVE domain-containing protein 1-like isoform X1 [Colletes gigas]|uniref:zinc finger FYVE domain-containing protein 1-like isoform X1 n=1 Tax=Colletes gigas TaxID=935657 RepID=UPI001C9A7BCB|nr:zinc finger FYVE domain-containing protein 1-like isoform X1 [Colletes gigas]XP_043264465.1 zinc finger FYVE domain-containing protein 1-like isoform X1 [Colletes gigas]
MSGLWEKNKFEASGPAIMKSLNNICICDRDNSVSENGIPANGLYIKCSCRTFKSFLLIDEQEYLKVSTAKQFVEKLNCSAKDVKVKVVSVFGNIGDGKSHMLNQTFFKGKEVFKTSNKQNSCTIGVWAAFDPLLNVICLDTEGLLGINESENERTRLLLKVLAVSDIVVYRTQSEKLKRDLFTFLGTASRAYSRHFQAALQAVGQKEDVLSSSSVMGPSVIVLHETRYTEPLNNNDLESAENILKTQFNQMKLETEAFSSIKYVGVQATNSTTDYRQFLTTIKNEINNTSVRSARHPRLVYDILKILNDRFSEKIDNFSNILFPDQYFTCPVKCLSCECRCSNSMGHLREGKPHCSSTRCQYQHQYENIMYTCKKCYDNGNEVQVTKKTENNSSWYGLVKYAWSGDVIDCPHCGEIYRSRQYWYGNKNPEEFVVRTEIVHVWNAAKNLVASQNTAQRVVDGVSYITEAVTNVSLQPTKMISAWVADQVAPSYWRPNNEIKHCHKCKTVFGPTDTKHHCRACGEGFCAQCSSQTKCVPSRNWYTHVRVCDTCYNNNDEAIEYSEDVNARKVTETVVSTLSTVGTVLNYSKSFIKDTARPSYWVPDSEIVSCCICNQKFSVVATLHHCRDCGRGVCENCSQHRNPVPSRGWDKPVRVCDSCRKIH